MLFYATMPALSALNAGVGLLLPMLLAPVAFGHYALVVTLFQYGLVFDFGLSQLTDRLVPKMLAAGDASALRRFRQGVLWTRLYIAVFLLVGGAVAAVAMHYRTSGFPAGAAWLSLAAGVGFMVVLGPGSFYRAASERAAFGRINIAAMLILAIARPVGLVLGGITGVFAMLGVAYAVLAGWVQAGMPVVWSARPAPRAAFALIRQGLPLFLTSFVWAFYLTANRWVVSGLVAGSPAGDLELGHFAFGSNVVTLIIGAVGALAQFYYPRIVTRCASGGAYAVSSVIRRDFCLLGLTMGMITLVGMVAGPPLIGVLYPKFLASVPVVLLLMLAVPSLVVAAWLMPLSLSTAERPWREGLVVYPTALLIQLAVTRAGYELNGITGAALGLVASALPLLMLQLWVLHRACLLRWRDAASILAVCAAVTMVSSLLV